jgi:hypothetical protein
MQALTTAKDAVVQMIDTSMVRVHQHAANIADSGTSRPSYMWSLIAKGCRYDWASRLAQSTTIGSVQLC